MKEAKDHWGLVSTVVGVITSPCPLQSVLKLADKVILVNSSDPIGALLNGSLYWFPFSF